ncbi:MAG: metal-dependent phosphohydrolase [Kordiimonadales bacterium]|nr:MAG: metal-dependent phosphohydrolase [Kordiimonadales bacterium]
MTFTRMQDGNEADWAVIADKTIQQQQAVPAKIMEMLRELETLTVGFACDQLQHSLMTATLARRDNATDEEVLIALLHDIGKVISIPNHAAIAAEMVRPYVSDDAYKAVLYHQHFQGKFYYQHFGGRQDMREAFNAEPWYALAKKFVDDWDAPAFDPDFEVDTLESFEPLVRQSFAHPQGPYMVKPIKV